MTPDFVAFERAVELVLGEARRTTTERVPLELANGRVLAVPLRAPRDVPAESASLMDGYALRAAEAANELVVAFEIPAGRAAPRPLAPGECARIFTGAPTPPGADAVVMQEHVDRSGDRIRCRNAIVVGEHVRAAGSDARAGDELIADGTMLDAGGLSLAAAMGQGFLDVARRPTVAILATGDELRAPGEPLGPGLLYESNTFGLAQQARDAGADPRILGIARDDAAEIADRLGASGADVLVTSGGASVGDYDFARAVLERLGGTKVFWQVAIRPGKPVLFGTIARGREAPALFFALPGNPAASALTFDLFVRPALLALQGARRVRRSRVRATLAAPLKKPEHLTFLARGTLVERDASLHFEPASLQGSMSIPSLSGLAAVAIVPAGVVTLAAGALVEVEPWTPLTGASR